MNFDDEKFERQLRSFHPRAATPLPTSPAPIRKRIAMIAVAVPAFALLVLFAALFWNPGRPKVDPPLSLSAEPAPTSVAQWNAYERAHQLEDGFALSARHALPRTDQPNSALNVLAKD